MRPVRILVALFALSLVAALLPTASAHAAITPTPVAGRPWTVPVIRLYDTTPRLYREGINIAIREWNLANVGIKFARTTDRRRAHVVVKPVFYPGWTAGMATLGATSSAYVGLDTSLIAVQPIQRGNVILDLPDYAIPEEIADVMAHELGHVLGLKHTSGCSLMSPNGATACGNTVQEGRWNCRMIQRKDLIAAARRYGGVGVLKPQRTCPRSATPAGPVGVIKSTTTTNTYATRLSWREVTNGFGFVLSRSSAGGGCPTTPDGGALRKDLDFPSFDDRWSDWEVPIVAGRYCYSIWSQNGRGALRGPTRVFVDVNPPIHPPVTGLQAVATGSSVQVSWTAQSAPSRVRIERYRTDGTCADHVDATSVPMYDGASSATDSYVQPGTWTYMAIRSDATSSETGQAVLFPSVPACVDVAVASPPPEDVTADE